MTLTSQLLKGTYPDYPRLIPTEHTTRVVVNRKELREALAGAATMVQDNGAIVRLVTSAGFLVVSAVAKDTGSYSCPLPAEITGTSGKIAINHRYLQEMLTVLSGEQVALELTSPRASMVWSDPDDADYLEVIMAVFVLW